MEENDRGQRPVIVAGVLQEGISRRPVRTRGLRPSTEGVTSLHDLAKAEAMLKAIKAVIFDAPSEVWLQDEDGAYNEALAFLALDIASIVKGYRP